VTGTIEEVDSPENEVTSRPLAGFYLGDDWFLFYRLVIEIRTTPSSRHNVICIVATWLDFCQTGKEKGEP
jgi:hypothetical protein